MRPRAIPRQPLVTTHPTPSTTRCCYSCSFSSLLALLACHASPTTTDDYMSRVGGRWRSRAGRGETNARQHEIVSASQPRVVYTCLTWIAMASLLPSFLLVRDRDDQSLRHEVCAAVCCDGPIVHDY